MMALPTLVLPDPRVRLGRRSVSWFHVCGLAGGVAAVTVAGIGAGLRNLPLTPVLVLAPTAVMVFLALAVGTALVVGEGRLTWFHHQLAIVLGSSLVLLALGRPVLAYLDLVGAGLLAFGAFGRLGCLLVGCCHGRPAQRGVVYGPAHVEAGMGPAYAGVVLVPVQLVEGAACAVLALVCLVTLGSGAPAGTSLAFSLVGYAMARFVMERLRGDTRPRVAGLSEAQWTAVAVTLGTLAFWSLA